MINPEDNCVYKKVKLKKMQDEFLTRLINADDDFEDSVDDDTDDAETEEEEEEETDDEDLDDDNDDVATDGE